MRCQVQHGGGFRYYQCRAKEHDYECDQPGVRVESIDEQVVNILKSLKPPKDWRIGVIKAVSEMLGERTFEERLAEIRTIIKRMDLRWDQGFFTNQDEYTEERI